VPRRRSAARSSRPPPPRSNANRTRGSQRKARSLPRSRIAMASNQLLGQARVPVSSSSSPSTCIGWTNQPPPSRNSMSRRSSEYAASAARSAVMSFGDRLTEQRHVRGPGCVAEQDGLHLTQVDRLALTVRVSDLSRCRASSNRVTRRNVKTAGLTWVKHGKCSVDYRTILWCVCGTSLDNVLRLCAYLF
jgi:hypothetical protein